MSDMGFVASFTCPFCEKVTGAHFMDFHQDTIERCSNCGEALHITCELKATHLTASEVASMTTCEILNATTAIGALLRESAGSAVKSSTWERASHYVDRLEKFVERIRPIVKINDRRRGQGGNLSQENMIGGIIMNKSESTGEPGA